MPRVNTSAQAPILASNLCLISGCERKVFAKSHLCGLHAGDVKHYRRWLWRMRLKQYPISYVPPTYELYTVVKNGTS